MGLEQVLDKIQDDSSRVIHTTDVDMYSIWHVMMRNYGYIPYDDFMEKMSCVEMLNLMANCLREAKAMKDSMPKTPGGIR